ncbi:MAG: hypothetical protein KGS48_18405 [Bacteroidetes bacterium]|nr:hypothetical protein [Bacteroidota bacterium]
MKNLICILFMVAFFSTATWAQTWICTHINFGYDAQQQVKNITSQNQKTGISTSTERINFLDLSSLTIRKNGLLTELTVYSDLGPSKGNILLKDSLDFYNTVARYRAYQGGLVFSLGKNLMAKNTENDNYRMLFGNLYFNPFYRFTRLYDVTRSIDVPEVKRVLGVHLGVEPRWISPLSSRFLLTMGLRWNILDFGYDHTKTSNPNLTPRQNENKVFDLSLFNGMFIRIGIGLRVTKGQHDLNKS